MQCFAAALDLIHHLDQNRISKKVTICNSLADARQALVNNATGADI